MGHRAQLGRDLLSEILKAGKISLWITNAPGGAHWRGEIYISKGTFTRSIRYVTNVVANELGHYVGWRMTGMQPTANLLTAEGRRFMERIEWQADQWARAFVGMSYRHPGR